MIPKNISCQKSRVLSEYTPTSGKGGPFVVHGIKVSKILLVIFLLTELTAVVINLLGDIRLPCSSDCIEKIFSDT